MDISLTRLRELLVGPGHITDQQFTTFQKAAEQRSITIYEAIVNDGVLTDEQLGSVLAEELQVPFVDLEREHVDIHVFEVVPSVVAENLQVIAYAQDDEGVHIGMVRPYEVETRHILEKLFQDRVIPHFITPTDLRNALSRYKVGLTEEMQTVLAMMDDPELKPEEYDDLVVSVVNVVLDYAHQNHASDIHIEPYKEKLLIRFRIDGVMHDVADVPKELADPITTRIKILSQMRIDEHRAAQDGKFRFTVHGVTGDIEVDVRVSILPVTSGENIVMRLLSSENRQFTLQSLGFSTTDLARMERSIKHPHGMILVTGPTGSGKTTSLYAVMKMLNTRDVHIATIEDPVEYDIEGVSQIQVNTRTDLTFAKGLRSIVRQDPDIIMVGEIRDEETAGIAVNAAMTGHLVLSTLHTNDAATTLPRLIDMNIEPFLVASTVNIIVAQRLVRTLCQQCRASYDLSTEERRMIESDRRLHELVTNHGKKRIENMMFFKGKGCSVCGGNGYKGRTGIFEVIEMSDEIRHLIKEKATSDVITKAAREQGMSTMLEDGVEKVKMGITSFDEILRVIYESS